MLLALCAVVGAVPPDVAADRAFGPRFSVNTQGDITIAANSIMSCLDALAACPSVRDGVGTGLNNNDRTMTWIDADSDPATFDSSSADLVMPAGAKVLFAGLYFGGKLTPGTGGSPAKNPSANNTVKFKAPGDATYTTLTAPAPVDTSSTQYQGFVDVTSIVAMRGRGNLLDRRRAARHREERRAVRRLGARRRLRGPGGAEPQPVGVRRDADRHAAAGR